LTLVDDAQSHVEHSKNDRHFHLDIVGNRQFVLLGDGPGRVLTEGIDASIVSTGSIILPILTLSESWVIPGIISAFSHFQCIGLRLVVLLVH
jgi:hypothetical protein